MKRNFTTLLYALISLVGYAQGQSTIKIEPGDSHEDIIEKAALVVPTANQYAYKKLEFTCFVHFGVNTFTRKEWGDGFEDPQVFNLQNLDTDQWCRTAKEAGMKLVMFTAKHHDGFVLWQSRYTKHGVMSSPFKDGKGDVLKELAASCEKYGLKLGVYLSPADLYQIESEKGLYGNLSEYTDRVIPRPVEGRPFKNKSTFKFNVDDYNEYFLNQLFELLTEYGPIHEVWFDGAHPKRKGNQKYNYLAWKKLIQTLAPNAVIFGKEDVRWCGNESGATRESEWDVVPFDQDPHHMNLFPDLHGDIGSREKLTNAKYLHYLPAETDTSIREGWFYRNEDEQKVRSADDVFDIYERSVGGNATFLLNIPPNREGKFSDEDVSVLKEVGKRIRETYDNDLLVGAKGETAILDANENTYVLGEEGKGTYVITLPQAITLNRFLLQEAIQTHGQRIEKHALDAWVNNKWQQVVEGTTIGYKRILRFPDVTTNKLRIRILEARSKPSLSNVSAHYYTARPPQLAISRNLKGEVTIAPKKSDFDWKTHGIDVNESTSKNLVIRYTTDGKIPNEKSPIFSDSFFLKSGEVKAKAFEKEQTGSLAEREFGLVKKDWIAKGTIANEKNSAEKAIDADVKTYWNSGNGAPELTIDLKETKTIRGFIYTPPLNFKEGLIEKGLIKVSKNGTAWKTVQTFDLGNLINDPTARKVRFVKKAKARYVQIISIRGAGGSSSASIAEIDILE
ncbi:alpha-L-fucosidase [Arenibacter nanhaiticus]|uniref:alpha-L-fucosidase n=1 Tax=Arenibacter nanhaiticus TaxID=558155 RepID=A0A1M6C6A8_9FLAO|nr:alpha-L-fucosidase [Arenibacter nanhaiticus]SHI56587.1 alpha-L-fucosidase [Arenibacter nanhaiticus]